MSFTTTPIIAENLNLLRKEISDLAREHGRDPSGIRLIAVSKTKPATAILEASHAGQIDFGENYAQEWKGKNETLKTQSLRWHFIGYLQSNKARMVASNVALIHTLDRLSLAAAIEKTCAEKNVIQDCLIEVKLAEEKSKNGCLEKDVPGLLRELTKFSHIQVRGLMTIGTLTNDEKKTRQEFKRLRELRDELNHSQIYREPLTELSMGMSTDYAIAIAEGATMIRVGTRIFGGRY